MGLEGGAQPEDGGEGLAQVVGDEGEELVLRLVEVARGRDVPDDALEPGGDPSFAPRARRNLEHTAHTVGAAHRQLGAVTVVGIDRESLEHIGSLEGRKHVGQRRADQAVQRPAQDHGQRGVGEDHPAVEVDLEDAVQ